MHYLYGNKVNNSLDISRENNNDIYQSQEAPKRIHSFRLDTVEEANFTDESTFARSPKVDRKNMSECKNLEWSTTFNIVDSTIHVDFDEYTKNTS